MSSAILPSAPVVDNLRRKHFTRSEVDRMQDIGVFDGQRYELIEGELIDKMGQNPSHALAITKVFSWLLTVFTSDRLRVQAPLECSTEDKDRNLPEPDVAILAHANNEFALRHPRGDETVLLVEVSDASLHQDLIVKRSLYARASVPEYWVLDIPSRRLHVHTKPLDGDYSETLSVAETDSAACAARPDHPISVHELLP